jgi:hypothetical protein
MWFGVLRGADQVGRAASSATHHPVRALKLAPVAPLMGCENAAASTQRASVLQRLQHCAADEIGTVVHGL